MKLLCLFDEVFCWFLGRFLVRFGVWRAYEQALDGRELPYLAAARLQRLWAVQTTAHST